MKNKMNELFRLIMNNKKRLLVIGPVILAIFIIVILINNFSLAEEGVDSLILNCPDTAKVGDEIECSVTLNVATIFGSGFQTDFEKDDNIIFKSFTRENCPSCRDDITNRIVAVDLAANMIGTMALGKIKYQLPQDAVPNSKYTIKLTNSLLSGSNKDTGKVESIDLDDVIEEIRILSNINTLSAITLSTGSLNEEVTSEVSEYTATVNSDKVVISVTKTDENSSVEGTGEVNLHYGTNTVNIKVTSEDETIKNYKIDIFRPYEFTTDKYVYNKDNNYIYTKTDTSDSAIKSNLGLPSDLTASINNNKLIISYNTEELLNINIANISSSKYTMTNEKIYVGKNVTYSEFIDSLNLNSVTAKVFNGSNEVTDGTLEENYKLKVYYGSDVIDEYTFTEEYFSISEELNVDDTNKAIERIQMNTTYEGLLSKIDTNGTITVNDKAVTNTAKIKTGDVVKVKLTDETYTYTMSVLGDINGDGDINTGDVALLYRYLKGKNELEKYQISAGDVLSDGNIKINDVARLFRYYKGKVSTLEVE